MENYVGKRLRIETATLQHQGVMSSFEPATGKLIIEDATNNRREFAFDEIVNVALVEEEQPLKEQEMHSMFYEAFNVFGPFESQFVYAVANSLKKFIRDMGTAHIKIVIGSDDVFGRIGLCFARLVLGKALSVSVVLEQEISDLCTLRYQNAFCNSGGVFETSEEKAYTMIVMAMNRNGNFNVLGTSSQVIVLDIPTKLPFGTFTGLGLGFVPENYSSCNKFYYLIDVGFGTALAQKYGLPQNFKNSLVKVDIAH